MSYKQNIVVNNGPVQLVDKSRFGNSVSQGGVTCTNNGDGSWTINGNVTAENRFNLNFYQLGANVIPYWLSYMVPVEHNYYTQDCGYDKLGGWLFYYLEEGKNYENFKIYPQIISLTDTFGSGNEPKNKEQVKAKLPENLYPYNPTNRVTTYKELIKVSDVCQLLDKSTFYTFSRGGTTATYNNDGTFTVSGTATADDWKNFPVFQLLPGGGEHVYLFDVGAMSNSSTTYCNIYFYDERTDRAVFLIQAGGTETAKIGIADTLQAYQARFNITTLTGATPNNIVYKPQLFDLTEMFGSGNEPKTIAEFKAKFPDELYPYSPNCWLTSYKNVSKVGEVCQLLDKSKYPATMTMNGVTYTNNGDGTINVKGTRGTTGDSYYRITWTQNIIKEHVYCLLGVIKDSGVEQYCLSVAGGKTLNDKGSGDIETNLIDRRDLIISLPANTSVDTVVKPQLFDLTEMYGAGNEPKTVTEFREKFPEELYDYSPRCII